MPLYEFRCSDCGIFDQWRSMAEATAPAYCPTCEQPATRIFSAPAVLSGSLRLKTAAEPQVVQRSQEPQQAKVKSHAGRPWMIGH